MDSAPEQGEQTAENGGQNNGNIKGPNSKYIKLISSDWDEFIIEREHAVLSGTIRIMLSGPGEIAENESNEIHLTELTSDILKEVCDYLAYKHQYICGSDMPVFNVKPELALNLLLAANFLDC